MNIFNIHREVGSFINIDNQQVRELIKDELKIGKSLILKLRDLHKELDNKILKAYGWQDINLNHDFREIETLPENDRIRYAMTKEARKELLQRLLQLNLDRTS